MKKLILFGLLLLGLGTGVGAQVEIARESFENSGGHGYTTFPGECDCCAGSTNWKKEETDSGNCYGETFNADGDFYWISEYTTNVNAQRSGNPYGDVAIVQLNKVAVTNFDELEVRFLAGHGILGEMEKSDYLEIQYAFDMDITNDNYTTASQFFGFSFDSEELVYDSNADGFLDGDTLTRDFAEFVADLGTATGDTLSVRFVFFSDRFGEEVSLDNIRVVGNQVPLPLELRQFSLSQQNEGLDIDWETINEVNVARFEIQRSINLRNWEVIHEQSAKGAGTYTFQDLNFPQTKTLYYRLQWIDFDGQTGFSSIRSFSPKAIFAVGDLFPNPANLRSLEVNITTKRDQAAKWQLYNLIGEIQQLGVLNLEKGAGTYEFDLVDLPEGVYIWHVEVDGKIISRKLVIGK
jgi:hypothetical protein